VSGPSFGAGVTPQAGHKSGQIKEGLEQTMKPNMFDGLTVRWLSGQDTQCEAFLGSDETPTVEDAIPCSAKAEVLITYNSGRIESSCHHHYITRTANPNREILE